MRRVVKERIGGEDYYAVWSSVVMDLTTEFMPRAAMVRHLKKRYKDDDGEAQVDAAVHPDDVYR